MEYSQIFVDFEENKKKRSFKRKMVLDITPNTKFVYSLKGAIFGSFCFSYRIFSKDSILRNKLLNILNPLVNLALWCLFVVASCAFLFLLVS